MSREGFSPDPYPGACAVQEATHRGGSVHKCHLVWLRAQGWETPKDQKLREEPSAERTTERTTPPVTPSSSPTQEGIKVLWSGKTRGSSKDMLGRWLAQSVNKDEALSSDPQKPYNNNKNNNNACSGTCL